MKTSPQGRVLSTDPNAGEPLTAPAVASPRVLSSDPNAGEPLRVNSRAQTWPDRLGLNEPTDSMLSGFLRGSGGAAVDMAQGAASRVTGLMDQKLRTDQAGVDAFPPAPDARSLPRREMPAAMLTAAPQTTAGTIGTYLPDAAAIVAPTGAAAKAGYNAIPRVARAGEKFQQVMVAAKDIPIDVREVGDVALRINQLAERGGSMPMAVRKILNRMTDPSKGPMIYEEGRDFASNISRLSANEFGRLTPAVAREVANLRVSLNQANAAAAKAAGKGAEHKAAMLEYAQAMKLKSAVDAAWTGMKAGAPAATVAGAGYWLTRQIRAALGGGE